MYSECQDTFPLISLNYLIDFCRKVNLLPEDVVKLSNPKSDAKKLLGMLMGGADQEGHDGIRQFSLLNRSQLLKFLLWAFSMRHEHDYFPSRFDLYLENKIHPLIERSSHQKVRKLMEEDEQI